MAALCRDYLNISSAVGNTVHHFKAACNAAHANRFIALSNDLSLCCTVFDSSAEASSDDKTTALSNIALDYSSV